MPIKEKLNDNGSSISSNKDEFNELLDKIRYLEEAQTCSICMERKKGTPEKKFILRFFYGFMFRYSVSVWSYCVQFLLHSTKDMSYMS